MIEQAGLENAHQILDVINTSDREAFKAIIPAEHFIEPILALDQLLEDFSGRSGSTSSWGIGQ